LQSPFFYCEPFEYFRACPVFDTGVNSLRGACLHAEVTFRHAGVAISLFLIPYEIASVLPLPQESLAMTY
jgi:hypothetical protein